MPTTRLLPYWKGRSVWIWAEGEDFAIRRKVGGFHDGIQVVIHWQEESCLGRQPPQGMTFENHIRNGKFYGDRAVTGWSSHFSWATVHLSRLCNCIKKFAVNMGGILEIFKLQYFNSKCSNSYSLGLQITKSFCQCLLFCQCTLPHISQ